MRICIYLCSLLFAVTQLSALAESPEVMTVDEAEQKGLLLSAVRPDFPYEARARRKTGSGIFELKFDYESGRLREVHVVKSTNDRYLDGHAIGALKLWKAKPHSIHTLQVPVKFTMASRE